MFCTQSRALVVHDANQALCGVSVSHRGTSAPVSLGRWNAILCSPLKRITTRLNKGPTRHGKGPFSKAPKNPWRRLWIDSRASSAQLAGMMMCHLAVLQGLQRCGSRPPGRQIEHFRAEFRDPSSDQLSPSWQSYNKLLQQCLADDSSAAIAMQVTGNVTTIQILRRRGA
jgi:hypothetical protein